MITLACPSYSFLILSFGSSTDSQAQFLYQPSLPSLCRKLKGCLVIVGNESSGLRGFVYTKGREVLGSTHAAHGQLLLSHNSVMCPLPALSSHVCMSFPTLLFFSLLSGPMLPCNYLAGDFSLLLPWFFYGIFSASADGQVLPCFFSWIPTKRIWPDTVYHLFEMT